MNNSNISLAFFPLTTCSGCENAIIDIWSDIPNNLINRINIVYSPLLTDFREPISVDVGIITGIPRFVNDYDKLIEWRKKSKVLVAFGSCACYGGLPGLLNTFATLNVIKDIYNYSNYDVICNKYDLPKLSKCIRPLSDMIKIDIMVPGCPPPKKIILNFLNSVIEGRPFNLSNKSVCAECPLNTGEGKQINDVKRFSLQPIDLNKCFLEQGILCLGPITMSGCDAKCIKSGTPCRGCLGPIYGSDESALKFLASLASSIAFNVINVDKLNTIKDLIGLLYRFTLPSSRLFLVGER